MLSHISDKNRLEENRIFEEIKDHIDKKENVLFLSGAGSGKTYSLVQSILYLLETRYNELAANNQKIICITYTNAAADEVKRRLGQSDIVLVSTIHERIWQIIRPYEKELDEIHREKIESEILKLTNELSSDDYSKFQSIDDHFIDILLENRKVFYDSLSMKAEESRKYLLSAFSGYLNNDTLKNINSFRKWANRKISLRNLTECLESIKNGTQKKHAYYDAMSNSDRLYKMAFSHDTLLEHGKKIIERYPRLAQIIIDSYPYFFIDEYQDTATNVIEIVKILVKISNDINHDFWLGLFGDNMQNIYDEGVGNVSAEELNLRTVYKPFNRRSANQIIEVANRIRNQKDFSQRSIFEESQSDIAPTAEFITTDDDTETLAFIETVKHRFGISEENKLHVFVLTNKFLAERLGISEIFDFFYNSPYYKEEARYNLLSNELLSTDTTKLGASEILFYNLIRFCYLISKPGTTASDVFSKDEIKDLSVSDLWQFAALCRNCIGETLQETLNNISSIGERKDISDKIKTFTLRYYRNLWGVSLDLSLPTAIATLSELLHFKEEDLDRLHEFFEIKMKVFYQWYKHIAGIEEGDTIYHTYHSTKGLEYDNVAIIIDPNFARNRTFFADYFKDYDNSSQSEEIQKAQNLLYVAVTRARKHLAVLYRGNVTGLQENISKIFGSCREYVPRANCLL